MSEINLSRRQFLETSALATGGFVIAFYAPSPLLKKVFAQQEAAPLKIEPNAFVQIAPDNSITLVINKLEMGQGVNTSMAQLIAEELECDWRKIRVVPAPVNPAYNHTVFHTQMTGGSTALASSWEQHRKVGATMREMLKSAAAIRWNVPATQVRAENGFVVHPRKGKFSYGELATEASALPVPQDVKLKNPKSYKVIGQSMKRIDALEKSNGKAIYGLDVRTPNMLYAAVARPTLQGAKISSADKTAAKNVSGVVDVVEFGDSIAVLAKNTFAAMKGREALQAKWKNSSNGDFSTQKLMDHFKDTANSPGVLAKENGNVKEVMKLAAKSVTCEYEFPFLAHATMEPMNCTINFDGKSCEVWSGHQMPTIDRDTAAKTLGLPPEKVKVNTVYAGGSFGRRANKVSDYVVEACLLAKKVKKPLKVVWSREDDMHGGFYRPMNYHRVTLGFDDQNKFLAWDHKIVGQSVIGGSIFEGMMVKDGLEPTITEGVADTHYHFPQFRCEQHRMSSPVTTLWWRSVGHTHTAFVMETMIDELAEQLKQDPLSMRRNMLRSSPRHIAVLDLLAKQTNWGKAKPPTGRAWGLAIHESFNSVVGQVAEVSMKAGMPIIHKIWCAVHCGQVVNPEGARTQVEGGIVYGLSGAIYQQIEIQKGQVVQKNFNDYPVMRMKDMPKVYVEFVKTSEPPTGLGEPGVPPAAPAVANAIYRLTKTRLRTLPFVNQLKGAKV